MALVWNWAEDSLYPYDLGGPKTWGAVGIIPGTAVSFDADNGTFNAASGTFDEETYNPFQSRILWLDANANKAYQNDSGETYDGIEMTVYAERTGMAINKDLGQIKRIRRIFPRILGQAGDTITFYIGARTAQNASTQWHGPYTYTIGSDYKIDLRVSARLLDMKFEYSGSNTFRLHGMTFEFENDGYR